MEITEALRKYAVENLNVAADAADDDIRKAVSDAITKGDLDLDTLKKLMTTKAAGAEARIAAMVDEQVKKAFDANLGPLNEKLDALGSLLKPAEGDDKADDPPADTKADDTPADDTPPLATKNGAPNPADTMTKAGTAGIDGAGAADGYNIRVKSVVEQFDDTRTAATWAKSSKEHLRNTMGDQQLKTATEGPGARPINMPTERSQAITGAWFRKMVAAAFRRLPVRGFARWWRRRFGVRADRFRIPIGCETSTRSSVIMPFTNASSWGRSTGMTAWTTPASGLIPMGKSSVTFSERRCWMMPLPQVRAAWKRCRLSSTTRPF